MHIALRDDADVTTESRGDGFYKRVAIILRSRGDETTTDDRSRNAAGAGAVTDDTIVAPATPLGRSALAIVRIDGPGSAAILAALIREADLPEVRHGHAREADDD